MDLKKLLTTDLDDEGERLRERRRLGDALDVSGLLPRADKIAIRPGKRTVIQELMKPRTPVAATVAPPDPDPKGAASRGTVESFLGPLASLGRDAVDLDGDDVAPEETGTGDVKGWIEGAISPASRRKKLGVEGKLAQRVLVEMIQASKNGLTTRSAQLLDPSLYEGTPSEVLERLAGRVLSSAALVRVASNASSPFGKYLEKRGFGPRAKSCSKRWPRSSSSRAPRSQTNRRRSIAR